MAEEHVEHTEHHHVNYTAIFVALCVCTLLSILLDVGRSQLGRTLLASLVLGVACFKASFVMLYFMHLKFEGPWKYVLLAPTTVLAMALPFALAPDISYHYYAVQVPQEMEEQPAHAGSDHGGTGHGTADAHGKAGAHGKHSDAHPAHRDAGKDAAGDHKSPASKGNTEAHPGRPVPASKR